MSNKADDLRQQVLALVSQYHAAAFAEQPFVPGSSPVPVAGKVFDDDELRCLVDSSLDFWLTAGRYAERFEREFGRFFGLEAMAVNSGSSANLLALSCLTSAELGDRRLTAGDEVITVAAGFPTTVNPILQCQLVPVFLDIRLSDYNVDVSQLDAAILGPRTRAIFLAHTLGNPFDLETVTAFARKHDLWLIEDCCDAVGTTYDGRLAGTFGDLATTSFYPAHHITMGEGGAVLTGSAEFKKLVESFRDWGRHCWCKTGHDNTCGRRFDWKLGDLSAGYDHKYIYSHIGYNLKITDMQAAVAVAQLVKLPRFIEARRRNFATLRSGLDNLAEVLLLPTATAKSEPSWFGFPIGVRDEAPFTREQLVRFLESRKIATRLLFGGNLVRQPAYREAKFTVIGDLANSDWVMNRAFWIGVYPGLRPEQLAYVIDSFHEFCKGRRE